MSRFLQSWMMEDLQKSNGHAIDHLGREIGRQGNGCKLDLDVFRDFATVEGGTASVIRSTRGLDEDKAQQEAND
eukprot:CAMPEP_0184681888 /NCGR_PEP_ID=MMETSP0312-20130426/4881_1 /TAXON_ID=31354 /ORGANISM="Compsopogon coeruleus, Strain SAG 36.94" /LENGTH=73 /DNA_ID=CAMNT_0027133019 /DNA_START=375 /DNA_END=596 /DNA_ORIENTATION=-